MHSPLKLRRMYSCVYELLKCPGICSSVECNAGGGQTLDWERGEDGRRGGLRGRWYGSVWLGSRIDTFKKGMLLFIHAFSETDEAQKVESSTLQCAHGIVKRAGALPLRLKSQIRLGLIGSQKRVFDFYVAMKVGSPRNKHSSFFLSHFRWYGHRWGGGGDIHFLPPRACFYSYVSLFVVTLLLLL